MLFNLTLRHLKIHFRDKVSVFFSLLSVFIIIGLYVLFLGDLINQGQTGAARSMNDQWIMSGVIAVSGFTTTLGAYGILVDDKAKKLDRDFIVAPIKPAIRVLSYLLSSLVIGTLMSVVTLVFAQIYILIYGGPLFSFLTILKVLGLILLNVLTSSSIVFFIINFIKTTTAFSTISTIVGTIIGFLMGIYVPIGNLPSAMHLIIMLFPSSHAGVLFRQVMMEDSLVKVFQGAPPQERLNMEEFLGVRFVINGTIVPVYVHYLVLIGTILVFYFFSLLTLKYKKSK